MSESTVRFAVARLTVIAILALAGLVALAFAPGDTQTVQTILAGTLVGSVTAVAGIVQVTPRTTSPPKS